MRKTHKHRLICGDSSNVQHIDALMDGHDADMVYTDPPYGMRLDTDYGKINKAKAATPAFNSHKKDGTLNKSKVYAPVIGDNEDYDPSFLLGYFKDVAEVFLWGADYYCWHISPGGSWVVWDKRANESGATVGENFHGSHFELCWSKAKHQRLTARIMCFGFYGREAGEHRVHPTQKPVALSEWFLQKWGKPGDLVVDLYGGSGSTLLACEKQGRRCFMSEIDPAYCDVILSRYQRLAGFEPELLNPPKDTP